MSYLALEAYLMAIWLDRALLRQTAFDYDLWRSMAARKHQPLRTVFHSVVSKNCPPHS